MAIRFVVQAVVKGAVKELEQAQRDSDYANRAAVTKIASNGRKALAMAIKEDVNKPVPLVAKAYSFTPARDLKNPEATIQVANPVAAELIDSITTTGEHIETEATIQARNNAVLRGAEVLVPTRRAKRNSRDNVGQNYRRYRIGGGGIVRNKNPDVRGIYAIVNRKFTKVLTPATPKNYTPLFNEETIVNKEIAKGPKIYEELYARNRARSEARSRGS